MNTPSETRLQTILLFLIVILLAYGLFRKPALNPRFEQVKDDPYFSFDTRTGMLCKNIKYTSSKTPSESHDGIDFQPEEEIKQGFYTPMHQPIPFCSDLVR